MAPERRKLESQIVRYRLSVVGTAEDDDSDAFIPHVCYSTDFAALVEGRLSCSSEPAHPPSAWPYIYARLFETLQSEFQGTSIDIEFSLFFTLLSTTNNGL